MSRKRTRMRPRTIAVVVILILAPLLIQWWYYSYTSLPAEIKIATGPVQGEWQALSLSLADNIESKCGIDVDTSLDPTAGALEHLQLLKGKEVDFALYLRGSRRMAAPGSSRDGPPPMFVGNVYPDVTLFLVRRDLYEAGRLRSPADLAGPQEDRPLRVAVGRRTTGEHTIAQAVLDYYFADRREVFEEVRWNYEQVEQGFESEELDAALITAGRQAPIFERLTQDGLCAIGEIPEVDAIVLKNVGLASATIPRGLFRYGEHHVPETPLKTITSQTVLLAHEDVSTKMVEEVAKILLSEDFIQDNQLFELSREGSAYASRNPEFEIHPGALHVYEPQMKPLVDPDFMEAIENLRSFAVSLLIGAFLGYQWYRRHAGRRKDHRLDEYFTQLLAIDRDARRTIDNDDDAAQMRDTLERVVALRNDALGEFSARDFDEDSAADSFLSLCETIAAGLRSQLLRWDLLQGIQQLARKRAQDEGAAAD